MTTAAAETEVTGTPIPPEQVDAETTPAGLGTQEQLDKLEKDVDALRFRMEEMERREHERNGEQEVVLLDGTKPWLRPEIDDGEGEAVFLYGGEYIFAAHRKVGYEWVFHQQPSASPGHARLLQKLFRKGENPLDTAAPPTPDRQSHRTGRAEQVGSIRELKPDEMPPEVRAAIEHFASMGIAAGVAEVKLSRQ